MCVLRKCASARLRPPRERAWLGVAASFVASETERSCLSVLQKDDTTAYRSASLRYTCSFVVVARKRNFPCLHICSLTRGVVVTFPLDERVARFGYEELRSRQQLVADALCAEDVKAVTRLPGELSRAIVSFLLGPLVRATLALVCCFFRPFR